MFYLIDFQYKKGFPQNPLFLLVNPNSLPDDASGIPWGKDRPGI